MAQTQDLRTSGTKIAALAGPKWCEAVHAAMGPGPFADSCLQAMKAPLHMNVQKPLRPAAWAWPADSGAVGWLRHRNGSKFSTDSEGRPDRTAGPPSLDVEACSREGVLICPTITHSVFDFCELTQMFNAKRCILELKISVGLGQSAADGRKSLGLERGSAHEKAVDLALTGELCRVVRLHGAAIQEMNSRGLFLTEAGDQ